MKPGVLSCLAALVLGAGCVAPVDGDDVETSVDEAEMLNCSERDPDCTPYPEPPAPKQPDLVPTFVTASDGRCYWDGVGLRIGVKNTGTATAVGSLLWIQFSASYGRWYTVPSIAPGASVQIPVVGLVYDPSCEWQRCTAKVIADYGGGVTESNETNNTTSRTCSYRF